MSDRRAPGRVLAVFAHPDDAEFSFGGTIARWTASGAEIHYVCVTDGSAGHNQPGWTRDRIAEVRSEELRAAAKVLGVTDVVFLGYVDGYLELSLGLRRDLTREVRRVRPDVIVSPDPSVRWVERRYVNHPDHRAVGEAMLFVVNPDAPSRPQFPELLDEGLEPFEVPELWMPTWDLDEADEIVDISGTIEAKCESLRAHASQMENMGVEDADEMIRDRAAELGARAGVPFAEAFKVFRLTESAADGARTGARADAPADAGSAGFEEG